MFKKILKIFIPALFLLFVFHTQAFAANYFWVGGSGTWGATDTNFALTSGGTPGILVPGSGDTVTFDSNSGGGTVTIATPINVTSITMSTFTGTLDDSANNEPVTLFSLNAAGTSARTLNLGSATWNLTGNNTTILNVSTTTNLTLNPGTSTVEFTYSGSTGTRTIDQGGLAFNNFLITAGSDAISMPETGTFNGNFSTAGYTGTFTKTAASFSIGGNFTVGTGSTWSSTGGTITLTSSSSVNITTNGVTVNQSITINGSGTFTLQSNLTMTGSVISSLTLAQGTLTAGSFNITASIMISSGTGTKFLNMGSGTWTLVEASGNAWNFGVLTGLTVNCQTSSVVLSGNAASSSAGGFTYNNFSFTGGGLADIGGNNTFNNLTVTGVGAGDSFEVNSSPQTITGTFTVTGASSSNKMAVFSSTAGSLRTIIFNQASFLNVTWTDITLTMNGTGNTWTLQENLILTSSSTAGAALNVSNGTLAPSSSNYTITTGQLTVASAGTLTIGTNTNLTLTGTGSVLSIASGASTVNVNGSTILLNNTTNTAVAIVSGSGRVWNNLTISRGASTGSVTIDGSNTWNTITSTTTAAYSFVFEAATTNTVSSWSVSGTSGNLISIDSSTSGTLANIVSTSNFSSNYLSIKDISFKGGGILFAGMNSTNVSDNFGIIFWSTAFGNGAIISFI